MLDRPELPRGLIAFADDVVLLSPTLHALKCQLKICAEYAEEFSVSFNPSKCKLIHMPAPHALPVAVPPTVRFMNADIATAESDKHLGLVIGNITNEATVTAAIADFNKKVAMLRAHFKWLSLPVMYQLFKTHCMPLYGSVLWDLSSDTTDKFYVAWRKAVRLLLQLPPRTHCSLLAPLCSDKEPRTQIALRYCKFVRSLGSSSNDRVQQCLAIAVAGSQSAFGRSLSAISALFGISRHQLPSSVPALPQDEPNPDAGFLRDLLYLRHDRTTCAIPGSLTPQSLTLEEINYCIYHICTN